MSSSTNTLQTPSALERENELALACIDLQLEFCAEEGLEDPIIADFADLLLDTRRTITDPAQSVIPSDLAATVS